MKQPADILGISCFYHDGAAVLVRDGKIFAAAQEEWFSRKRRDCRFPKHAAAYCLTEAGIGSGQLAAVAFYDRPTLPFHRQPTGCPAGNPGAAFSRWAAVRRWLGWKLYAGSAVRKQIGYKGRILFADPREAHAASAFYPSPFARAAILTLGGSGERAVAGCGVGEDNRIRLHEAAGDADAMGLLYSALAGFAGFGADSGRDDLMALAPHGKPVYRDLILTELVEIDQDGSLRFNAAFFGGPAGAKETSRRAARLFGGPARVPGSAVTRREADIAASLQAATEEIVLKMAGHVHRQTGMKQLCMAGGMTLNGAINQRLLRQGPFDDIWIQPATGGACGALGAALSVWHRHLGKDRQDPAGRDSQKGSYLGPAFTNESVVAFLEEQGYCYHRLEPRTRSWVIAREIADGRIVGYFAGRMEYGACALGARCILGDPRRQDTLSAVNQRIKSREAFQPLASSILEERAGEYFDLDRPSPYMLLAAHVRKERRLSQPKNGDPEAISVLEVKRSDIPAVTHLDYSARVQTVSPDAKPDYYDLIREFAVQTGCPVLASTSFNRRGEPIVCSLRDAYQCFMRTEMDTLVLEDCILYKNEQPLLEETDAGGFI